MSELDLGVGIFQLEVGKLSLTQQRGKTRHWLERYHFVVSTLALGLKINFDQPIKLMKFQ